MLSGPLHLQDHLLFCSNTTEATIALISYIVRECEDEANCYYPIHLIVSPLLSLLHVTHYSSLLLPLLTGKGVLGFSC